MTTDRCYLEVEGPWISTLEELFELTESLLSLLSRAFFNLSMYSCCDLANTCAKMPSSHSFRPEDERSIPLWFPDKTLEVNCKWYKWAAKPWTYN